MSISGLTNYFVPLSLDGLDAFTQSVQDNALLVDGSNMMLADLNMGTHAVKNMADAVNTDEAVSLGQLNTTLSNYVDRTSDQIVNGAKTFTSQLTVNHTNAVLDVMATGEDQDATLYLTTPYLGVAGRRKTAIIARGINNWSRSNLHFCLSTAQTHNPVTISDSKMCVFNNGNVGIGTAAPNYRFEVSGAEAYFTHGIQVEGNTSSYESGSVDVANRTNTYFTLRPAGSQNDWCYVRQIGGVDAYFLSFDFHDTSSDGAVAFRSVQSNATVPDTIKTFFTTRVSGTTVNNPTGVQSSNPVFLITNDGAAQNALWVVSNNTQGGWNPIVQAGDKTVLFSNGTSASGGLVIGPWTGTAVGGGLRVDGSNGNVSIGRAVASAKLDIDGTALIRGQLSMNTSNKIVSLADGTAETDAATVGQVVLRNGSNAMTGELQMGANKVASLANGTAATDAATVGQVVLRNGSNAMTGELQMGANKIVNVADPTLAQDAATKTYVDTTISTELANYVTLGTTQTITGDKQFNGIVTFDKGMSVNGPSEVWLNSSSNSLYSKIFENTTSSTLTLNSFESVNGGVILLNTGKLVGGVDTFSEVLRLSDTAVTANRQIESNSGLLLDGVTTSYQAGSVVDVANRTNTYLVFKPAGSTNDWAYLRQIGGDNSMTLSLDFHDDGVTGGDGRFTLRTVESTANPDGIKPFFQATSNGTTVNNPRSTQSFSAAFSITNDNAGQNALWFVSNNTPGGWNPLVQGGDKCMLFSSGTSGSGALVIGPWTSTAAGAGMRVDGSTGNVSIGRAVASAKLDVDGTVSFRGQLSMNTSNKIVSLADGTAATDAATVGQVVLRDGTNAMTAALAMGSNKVTGLANGTSASDAVTFGQLTSAINVAASQTVTSSVFTIDDSTPLVTFCNFNGGLISLPASGVSAGKRLSLVNIFNGSNATSLWSNVGLGSINGVSGAQQTVRLEYMQAVTLIARGSGAYTIESINLLEPHSRVKNDYGSNAMGFWTWDGGALTSSEKRMEISHTSVSMTVPLAPSAWSSGQTIKTAVYNQGTSGTGVLQINSGATSTWKTLTFTCLGTPASSRLVIEVWAPFAISGFEADETIVTVNDTTGGGTQEIVQNSQRWTGEVGGGTRSGAMLPIIGSYDPSNSTGTFARTIEIKFENSSNDNLYICRIFDGSGTIVDKNNWTVRITEYKQ